MKSQKGAKNLLDRVISILEQSRGSVVRTVNTNMVMSYWLIGCEIVHELQDRENRSQEWKMITPITI